jgi:ABC-type phosphate transport system substrate-binding protein
VLHTPSPALRARRSLLLTLLLTLPLVGCGSEAEPPAVEPAPSPLRLAAAHDAEELVTRWRRARREADLGDTEVTVTEESLALAAVIEGTAEAALVHRRATAAEERYAVGDELVPGPPLRYQSLGQVPVTLLIHAGNPVEVLDAEDAARLLTGSLREWDPVGGPSGEVSLYGRDPSTATSALLTREVLDGMAASPLIKALPSDRAVARAVASDLLGLGVGGGPVRRGVKEVALRDGGELLMPGGRTASGRDWPMLRELLLVTQGEPGSRAQAFVDYARSKQGRLIAEQSGYVPWTPAAEAAP